MNDQRSAALLLGETAEMLADVDAGHIGLLRAVVAPFGDQREKQAIPVLDLLDAEQTKPSRIAQADDLFAVGPRREPRPAAHLRRRRQFDRLRALAAQGQRIELQL